MPRAKTPKASATIKHFYFVTGNDESEVKKAAAELAHKLAPNDDPFALETIDGNVTSVDDALEKIALCKQSLLTLPFFGSNKLVWLKNASFLSENACGRSDAVADALEQLAATIEREVPDTVTVLFSAPEPDKRRSSYKRFSAIGNTVLKDKPDFGWNQTEEDIIQWVLQRANQQGIKLSPSIAELLATRIGADTRQLDVELTKLQLAAENGDLSYELAADLIPATRQGALFDLSNAIGRRHLQEALTCLQQLQHQRESAVSILLVAIVPTIRNMLLVKDLMERFNISPPSQAAFFAKSLQRLPEHETAHLPRRKDGTLNNYGLGVAAMGAANFTLPDLRNALIFCRDANVALFSSGSEEDLVLNRLLIQIIGRR